MKKRQGRPFAVVLPMSALVVVIVLLLDAHAAQQRAADDIPPAIVVVEHQKLLTFTVHMGIGKEPGIFECDTESDETVGVSVPSSWKRREVRGAPLTAVTADPPSMGFTRWQLPPHATLSFWTDKRTHLIVRNVSPAPALAMGKVLNVKTHETQEKSVLIKEQETQLW